jgi:N-acetylglucosaminyldiphosphoundecaprenol N-acetyl-beta-D-mannosaminyltransferase
MNVRRVSVCGISVDCVDAVGALERAGHLLEQQVPAAIFAVNPEKAIQCGRNPALASVIESAGLLIPDGIGVVIAARLLHGARFARVPGCEFMPALCAYAAARNLSVFLFGGAPGVAEAAAEALRRANPSLRVAGCQHGYIDAAGSARLIDRLNGLEPDILFVALGSPRQELWVAENIGRLNVRLCQTVGGTFDVLAGRAKRCPALFRAVQLEWLYRLLIQPKRALRQSALPIFAVRLLRAYVTKKLRREAKWQRSQSKGPMHEPD